MAEVTVSQLAKTVGASVDRLLSQMKEAGLNHQSGDQSVSDEDKQKLLTHLKNSHGVSTAAPKRITLKRKTLGTVKAAGGQGRKTVSVEVRKKRTYIKRDETPTGVDEQVVDGLPLDESQPSADQSAVTEAVVDGVEAIESVTDDQIEAIERDTAELDAAIDSAEKDPSHDPFDVEELRQRAATKRKEQEALEKNRRDAVAQDKAEAAAREKAELFAKQQAEAAPKKEKAAPTKNFKVATPVIDDDEPRRKTNKGKKVAKQRGKNRGSQVKVDDFLSNESDGSFVSMGSRKVLQAVSRQDFTQPTERIVHEVALGESITVADLAQQMAIKAKVVVKELMKLGEMATINQSIDQETAVLLIEELGHSYRLVSDNELEEALIAELTEQSSDDNVDPARPPVVTVMGHVDHGKTSLLDYIRESKVASGEAGGITQHIGAYHVETNNGVISFLDTPGHAAFTAMRARGAKCTDIVVLVVAADDGVMPQTIEAVQHAKAAGVPLVIAVNKMDKEAADPERVKNELVAQEVVPEEWGGDTQFISVSAHTGEGVDKLLDALSLQAEMLELTAPVEGPAKGVVVESRLDKGRGNIASILVQEGTLRNGDYVLAGMQFGRVRNMSDERGELIETAGPSIPVEILGLDGTPNAGDDVIVVKDERKAREVVDMRRQKEREVKFSRQQKANLDNIFASFESAEVKTLNVLVKADVRGSVEAIISALDDIGNDEVKVNVISGGVGAIAEADVNLAATTSAVIFGFNVRADATARAAAEKESLEIRYYSIIYNLLDDVKDALSGMLAPEMREEILGTAEVRDVFKSPKFGLVAGCMVVEGSVSRSKQIRVLRENIVIHEGELDSLRRFKDDVSEVRSGTECGIGVKDYTDVKAGDRIEVFDIQKVARSL
ncbi:MAG: translation initiation factor IF-2 [Pseudomonadales bacterium]|nr:translation initiation factor IF-2 [Pseudomonadales bacterium]